AKRARTVPVRTRRRGRRRARVAARPRLCVAPMSRAGTRCARRPTMPSPLTALAALATRWFGHRRDEGPSRSSLAASLASGNGVHVATAASRIAAVRMAGFDADLLRALKSWRARDGEAADLVRLFLLDALVRTDAVVPAVALRPHLHGITEAVAFVLLVRSPRV